MLRTRQWGMLGWVWLGLVLTVSAQELQHEIRLPSPPDVRQEIRFPDLPGYQTLVCDFHMHSVFSDGSVWPPIRAKEAWRQGLHAIAITDHIEYQPHKDDLPTKHNRPYELLVGEALTRDILLVRGAEITRDTPPGHFNALFLKDVQALDQKDLMEVFRQAAEQGAFIFWNHPGWQGAEKGKWGEVQTVLYEKKWLHGIEICNGDGYHEQAHAWAMEKNLTLLGNSDIHEPDLRQKNTAADHRTCTLVFAKEKTLPALQEALRAGRTLVWWKDHLIGREEWLRPMFEACVQVLPPHHRAKNAVFVHIRNRSEVDIRLERTAGAGPAQLVLPAGTVSLVKINTADPNQPIRLEYTVANFLVAPKKPLVVTLTIPGKE